MKEIYLKLSLLIIIGGFATMSVLAALNFFLPVSEPGNWYVRFDSPYHTGKDQYAYDFNRAGGDVGQPVLATADGVVVFASNTISSGGMVFIKHNDGFTSNYAHLSARSLLVRLGDSIKQGQIIGYIGGSGESGIFSSGPHLHFAVYKQEPSGRLTAYNLNGILAFDSLRRYGSGGIVEKGFNVIKDFFFGKNIGGDLPQKPVEKIDLGPFQNMVRDFYKWALGIAGIVAFGVLIYAGILYIVSSGNSSKQNDAKEWIKAAISGLILLLAAYMILYTINPCIVSMSNGCL